MKGSALMVIILVASLFSATAQEISVKKEIAIFSLGYHGWTVPMEAMMRVDSQIIDGFVNLGRFEVIGIPHRLKSSDVGAFVEEIRRHKEKTIEISEGVRLGEVTFTEADFNQLTSSFIVVVPVVSDYTMKKAKRSRKEDANPWEAPWEAELNISLSFIKVESLETFAHLTVGVSGTGDTDKEALHSAVSSLTPQLSFKLRSIPEFTLKTGIVEVLPNGRVLLQFGQDMGIQVGDEFSLLRTHILATGHELEEEEGLIKIEKITDKLSYGYVLSSNGKVEVGEQLKEIPRFGLEIVPSGRALFNLGDFNPQAFMVGLRFALSRGVFLFRPMIGFESLFGKDARVPWGFPVMLYGGGEFVLHLRRLALRPTLAVGISGIIPISESAASKDFVLTHFGGLAELRISYLVLPGLRLYGSFGYSYWRSLKPSIFLDYPLFRDSYGGVTTGLGMTFKL